MGEVTNNYLTQRYPALYRPGFKLEVDDGWLGVLDALSETLVRNAELKGRPPAQARQVKEKFASLRWYHGEDDRDYGSISMASDVSGRICEVSGKQGRVSFRSGRWATRAPGIEPGYVERRDASVPPLAGLSADLVSTKWSRMLTGAVDVPPGWLDLADCMLHLLAHPPTVLRAEPQPGMLSVVLGQRELEQSAPVMVSSIRIEDGALHVDHEGGGDNAMGVIACAAALAQRIHQDTGTCAVR